MSEIIDIGMGDLCIAKSPVVLTTSSVGSCVAVCLYSSTDRTGAMAHIMLPLSPGGISSFTPNDYKYADIAIAVMVSELEKNGITRTQLIAKISGGANMFPSVQGRSHKIGEKNVESVKTILANYGIRISGEDTGGNSGRALAFDLANGIATIKVTI